jgi:hypothetical protein
VSVTGPTSIPEGDVGLTKVVFDIELSAPLGQAASVSYSVVGGTATLRSDYLVANAGGRISFAAGETKKSLAVQVRGDALRESNETFSVRLSAPTNCTLGAAVAAATIVDNDSYTMSIVAPSMMVPEGTPASVTIKLSSPATRRESMVCRAVSGTAKAGLDFEIVSSRVVTFEPGQDTQTVSVKTFAEGLIEGPEQFTVFVKPLDVRLGAEVGAVVFLTDGTTPQPVPPSVTVATVSAAAAEAGLVAGVVRFTRTGSTSTPLTVDYAVSGTAASGADYAALSGQVVFAAGDSFVDVPVTPVDDAAVEPSETVLITLKVGASYVLGSQVSATVTITSDDVTPPTPPTPPPTSDPGYQVKYVLPSNLTIDSKVLKKLTTMLDWATTKWSSIISGDVEDIKDASGKVLVDDFELQVTFTAAATNPSSRPWQQPNFGGAWFTDRRSGGSQLPYRGIAEITDKALTADFYDTFKGGDKLAAYKTLAIVGRAIGFNQDMLLDASLVETIRYTIKGIPKPVTLSVVKSNPPTNCASRFSSEFGFKEVPFDSKTWADGIPYWSTILGGAGSFGFDVFVTGWEANSVKTPYVSNVTRGLFADLGYKVRYV